MKSVDPFFGNPWTADQQNWFADHSSTITWSGTGTANNTANAIADFTYTFHLTGNEVAVGTFFDWATNINIPVLTIFSCPESGGGACNGLSLPMAAGPFPNQQPAFNGVTGDDFPPSGGTSPVSVPAAVWLFGSGLAGLVGVARRRKKA